MTVLLRVYEFELPDKATAAAAGVADRGRVLPGVVALREELARAALRGLHARLQAVHEFRLHLGESIASIPARS